MVLSDYHHILKFPYHSEVFHIKMVTCVFLVGCLNFYLVFPCALMLECLPCNHDKSFLLLKE